MSNYRINKSDLLETEDKLKNGTSAEFIAVNKNNSKKGVHKMNGCMLGINNEDVREKLASQIFQSLNIPCADIELVYDESTHENSCFSYYIINEKQKLVMPEIISYNEDCLSSVKNYIEDYCERAKNIAGICDDNLPQIRKNLAQLIFMDCIIDNYDRKDDNMELICDAETGEYIKTSPWYDYGVAFEPHSIQSNGIFQSLSNEEVMQQLFDNYLDDIRDLHNITKEKLTVENIDSLLSQEYCTDNFSKSRIEEIKNNLNMRIIQSGKMYDLVNKRNMDSEIIEQDNNNDRNQLVIYSSNIFQKIINKFNQFKNRISEKRDIKDEKSGEAENIQIKKEDKKEDFMKGLRLNVKSQMNISIETHEKERNPIISNIQR